MSSRRDLILDDMVAALNTASVDRPANLVVHRQRATPLSMEQLPAQVLYAVQEEVETGPGQGLDPLLKRKARRKLRVCLETRINAGSESSDEAIDPFLTWGVKQICGDPERTLSGSPLARETREIGTTWDEIDRDAIYASARTYFEVDYFTSASNPDSATV